MVRTSSRPSLMSRLHRSRCMALQTSLTSSSESRKHWLVLRRFKKSQQMRVIQINWLTSIKLNHSLLVKIIIKMTSTKDLLSRVRPSLTRSSRTWITRWSLPTGPGESSRSWTDWTLCTRRQSAPATSTTTWISCPRFIVRAVRKHAKARSRVSWSSYSKPTQRMQAFWRPAPRLRSPDRSSLTTRFNLTWAVARWTSTQNCSRRSIASRCSERVTRPIIIRARSTSASSTTRWARSCLSSWRTVHRQTWMLCQTCRAWAPTKTSVVVSERPRGSIRPRLLASISSLARLRSKPST